MTGTPPAKRAEVALRRTQAIELRNSGASFEEIAQALDYSSAQAASNDIRRALESYTKLQAETVEHHRAQSLAALDDMATKVREIMQRRHLVVQNGKIVGEFVNEAFVPLEDSAPILACIDRLMRIEERRAKLLGMDAPAKVEMSGQVVEYRFVGIAIEDVR